MNFTKSLRERNLEIKDLPKSQQKKISELTKLNEKVSLIEADLKDDTDEESIQSLQEIKKELIEADNDLVSFIENFDLEKSIQQRERLAKMREKKLNKTESGSIESVAAGGSGAVAVQTTNLSGTTVGLQEGKPQLETEPSTYYRKEDFREEAKLVNMHERVPTRLVEQHQAVEEEEFEKRRDVKKENMPISLIIMGIGAFFLTWGAVNFFKNKR